MALICLDDYEKKAAELVPKFAFDYYRSGACEEYTLQLNRDAFKRIRIRPRFLRDVSNRSMECTIFGQKLRMPLGISPTAMQKMAHPEGEVANARAAGASGCIFILSTIATSSIEEVAKGAPDTYKWFQLYVYRDRSITENLLRRAERHGYKAIVLTIDAQIFGQRRADMRNKFKLPPHLGLANFSGDLFKVTESKEDKSGINEYVTSQFDTSLSWEDVEWLVKSTQLPVILKGVMTREDAITAVKYGCKGIIVSNHGARQIDSVPASIEVLPEVVKAVGDKCIVMMDGGVRLGSDVYKALAIGAKAIFLGRPTVYGLAVNGQKGVEDVLEIIRKDLDHVMALSGCAKVADITKDMIVHESYYSKL